MQTNEVIEKVFKSKNTLYAIDEFKEYINDLENIFSFSNDNGKIYLESLGNFDSGQQKRLISSKSKNAPEEIIRQLWVYKLINHYGYSKEQIALERYITIGSTHFDKPVDIIVYSKTDQTTPKIIIEVKKPKRKDGLEQLKSYMEPQGSPLGMWSNGSDKVILYRPYPRDYDTVPDIPKASETIDDIFEKKNKLSDLDENYNFKKLIQNLEELAIADSGEDEFDEIFKILFAKMYDEIEAMESRNEQELFFRKEKNSEATYSTINNLFKEANAKWKGIFPKDENIRLKKGHLQVCVGPIQNLKIIGSNLKIFDDAFEYLIPTEAKKKKGQFFTPRNVIEMCVRILNPKKNEFIFDPSCGSAGFLIHALEWSFPNLKNINHKNEKKSNYASKYLWGIDFENKAIKTSKSMMLIAGDGSSNIFGPDVNSLNPKTWYETVSGKKFIQKLYESDLIDAEINDN